MAHGNFLGGHGNVQRLSLKLPVQCGGSQCCLLLFQRLLNGGTDLIGLLAHNGTLLRGERAHLLEQSGEFSLLAQKTHTQVFQLRGFFCIFQSGQRHFFNVFQLLFHVAYSLS